MKIRKVRLQNIKSYIDETIFFNEGVNFISGVNGAGKTSIIESIGFALFDSKPGINSEFIRYGQKTGIITVEFDTGDGCAYRVIRKIGNTNSWIVYDAETGLELDLHNAADVKAWLKDMLGLHQDQDLTRLFEDIIGVGQGMFTAPFLERPSDRRLKFNKMLKVEAYREAGDKSRSIVRELEDTVALCREERAEKEGSIKDYEALKEERTALLPVLQELTQQLAVMRSEMETKVRERNELRQKEKEIDRARRELELGEAAIKSRTEAVRKLEASLASSREAAARLEAAREGYEAFQEAKKRTDALELQRAERDRLAKEFNDTVKREVELGAAINADKSTIAEEEESIRESVERLDQNTADAVEGIKEIEQQLAVEEARLKRVEGTGRIGEELDSLLNRVIECRESLDELLTQWQSRLGKVEKLEERLKEEEHVRSQVNQLEAIEKKIGNLALQKAGILEKTASLKESRNKTAGGRCPFLDAECRNVEGNLEEYFDKKLKEQEEVLRLLECSLEKLEAEAGAMKDCRQTLSNMEGEKVLLRELELSCSSSLGDIIAQVQAVKGLNVNKAAENAAEGFASLVEILGPEESSRVFSSSRDAFIDIYKAFTGSWELALLLTDLNSCSKPSEVVGLADKLTVVYDRGTELSKLFKASAAEAEAFLEAELSEGRLKRAACRREIELLNKSKAELALQNIKLEEKTKALFQRSFELKKLQSAKAKLEAELSVFSQLEAMFGEVRQLMEDNQEPYDTYMKYQVEAERVSKLETELQAENEWIASDTAVLETVRAGLEKLLTGFSAELLSETENMAEKLKIEIAAKESAFEERTNDEREIRKKLLSMEKTKREIAALNMRIEKLGHIKSMIEYMRSVLNRAGERVAAVYREHLANEANRLYRDISKENVTVEWKNDYEVVLTDMFNGNQRQRCFRQLSGGEQMTAALAMRLSFLKQLSKAGIGFFDEPTTNLDGERRSNLVQIIPQVTGSFDQLFIISHDDSFDAMTENTIQLKKDKGEGTKLA